MFEKESQDYAMKEVASRQELYIKGRADIDADYEKVKKIWQDGAEFGYNKANEWHKLDWKKDSPDVDKLVRVKTKSGEEYICQTYLYYPTEDEIGYGSVIIQFEELNGDWVDDNEIGYWCYIEPFKEIE